MTHIAGTVGDRNRNVIVGSDNQQHDTHADTIVNNLFDAHGLRASFDEGFDEGMSELSRLIREFNSRIALLEYRLGNMEKASYVFFALLAVILWKLFFGG
jgi:hypothetical protein